MNLSITENIIDIKLVKRPVFVDCNGKDNADRVKFGNRSRCISWGGTVFDPYPYKIKLLALSLASLSSPT